MAEFAIPVAEIDDNQREFEFGIKRSWLAGVLENTDVKPGGGADGTLKVMAYRSGDDIIIKGVALATLTTECSRCCTDLRLEVRADLMLVMEEQDKPRSEEEEQELSTDELGREFYTGNEIDLDEIIRDHLLLEVPMQPRCIDPPCPDWVKQYLTTADEAPPEGEPEAASDPRLAPLAALKAKLKGEKN
jgi:uncharacterized protein